MTKEKAPAATGAGRSSGEAVRTKANYLPRPKVSSAFFAECFSDESG